MRAAAVLTVLVLAAPAFAQETQQDIAERLYREQMDVRQRAVEKVMSAPERAGTHGQIDPFSPIGADAKAEAPPPAPPAPKRPSGPFPWLTIALLIPAIPLALLAIATLRKWARSSD